MPTAEPTGRVMATPTPVRSPPSSAWWLTRQGHDHERTAQGPPGDDGADEWDARYAEADQVWSGNPNGALVTEVSGLPPGRALDVGCGEGADAVWLAGHGWDVTALDVSQVALDRAALHARQAGVRVRWVRSGLVE